jgi:hypothetical protein
VRAGRAIRTAAILVATALALCTGRLSAEAPLAGSLAQDSLLMPTETYVLTREDLIERNIHTLDDILSLLPGVSLWREGPEGSADGFSVSGRSDRGVNLFVNGSPVIDRYALEALTRFIPLSRLLRVEVIYSGSPYLTGDLSSNGAVNIVLEEGGRDGPTSEIDFTYGGANRRVRRAWFATPRAHIGGVIAYDEYLHDATASYPSLPSRQLGGYDMRSVLGELVIHSTAGEDVLLHFQRYEDTYLGTPFGATEDLRWSGFVSELMYRSGGFSSSVGQRVLLFSRDEVRLREYTLSGAARWAGSVGRLGIRAFTTAERSDFDNRLGSTAFSPLYDKVEGGLTLGAVLPSNVVCRVGGFGGDHNVVGRYGAAEAAIAKRWSARVSQDVVIARRLRIPSAQELFQPEATGPTGGDSFTAAGSSSLTPEVMDELSLGACISSFSVAIFGRDEKSRIVLSSSGPVAFQMGEGGRVVGGRGRFEGAKSIAGVSCTLRLAAEGFPDRKGIAFGIPTYCGVGELCFKRRLFRGSELLSIKLEAEAVGERAWSTVTLAPYRVYNIAACMSIMSARVSFDFKNILDTKYETVPGFEMPRRYYLIGIFWELFD